MEPQQQGALGGVAHHARLTVVEVEESRGVDGDALCDELSVGAFEVNGGVVGEGEEARFVDTHLILRERARLVGANHGGCAHRFAGMHLAHEALGFQHAPHAHGERERDAHGQALGHGDDNQRHGNHHRLQHLGEERQPLEAAGGIHIYKIKEHATRHDECGHGVAHLRDNGAESVELVVERRFYRVVDLRRHEYAPVFRLVAHGGDAHHAVPVHHRRAAQGMVGGVGGIFVKIFFAHGLFHQRLACECGFVDLQGNGFDEFAVGGDFVARIEDYDVAHHDVALRHFRDGAVLAAHHLHGVFVAHLVENVERPVGADLKPEGDARGEDNGEEDAGGFEECVQSRLSLAVLEAGDTHRGQ